MMANWIQSQLSFHEPALWLFLSLSFGGLLWLLRWLSPQWPLYRLQIAHWILIPYIGLLLGGLSPRLMGLVDVDWLITLELGFGLFLTIFLLLILVRAISASSPTVTFLESNDAYPKTTALATVEAMDESSVQQPSAIQWQSVLFDLLWSGANEFHWVFLRGAIWELLLFAPFAMQSPAYWAIWIAALFALPSLFAQGPLGIQTITQFVLLIATSILFFYTRNFWLCWALHAAANLILTPQNPPYNYTTKRSNLYYQNESWE